jgi:tRNA pseudouridine38-40 synthase
MRYFVCLSYDGSAFCGWQIQPSAPSVQQCLESALSRLLGHPVPVTGAGRTDTAVNAYHYVAHFDWDGILPFEASDFNYKLNAILPHGVAVHSVSPVADDLHARFSAKRREYTYFIHRQKDPFVRAYSWQCGYPGLDFDAMNKACQFLLGTHDFSCFEKTGTDNKTSICTVYEAFWAPYTPSHLQVMADEGALQSARPEAAGDNRGQSPLRQKDCAGASSYWYFRIAADRFLRNMVRATVGTLIEVGRGKHDPEWVAELIKSGTRGDAGESVPGNALFLNKVEY